MTTENVSAEHLRLFIERIEGIEEQMTGIKDDRKDVYAELKAEGFDVKTVRQIVRLRKIDKDARDEAEALMETYCSALGL
jgi:uncharacterized protein (UPF0335 family)